MRGFMKEVTSHDQKGGITAFNVNSKQIENHSQFEKLSKELPLWLKWLVAIATVIAAIVAIYTLFIL